jgi:hypothetical protein
MNTTDIQTLATTHCADLTNTLHSSYAVISPVVADTSGEVAHFATARTVDGNLGTYTTYDVLEMTLTGSRVGSATYVDGGYDVTRDQAHAIVAGFARIAAAQR